MDDVEVVAPGLTEVAAVWWDVDVAPVVRWRAGGREVVLADPTSSGRELLLARFDAPPRDRAGVARVLADGLAACDFPPTGDGADPDNVLAALVAGGRSERPAAG